MKKTKLFEVSLINKAYSRVVRDTTRFYTSDTALEIGFKLAEAEYSFDSGVILLLNEDDRSLVARDLVREGAGFIYTLEDDIIEHYGNWAAQLKFEKDGETYISSPVGFSIHNDLYNSRPPKLSEVNTWKNLRKIADGLIDDLREELEALEVQEEAISSAEAARQSAEDIRIENENQRNLTSVDEFVKLQNAIGGRNLVPDSDFTNGTGGWIGYYGSTSNVDGEVLRFTASGEGGSVTRMEYPFTMAKSGIYTLTMRVKATAPVRFRNFVGATISNDDVTDTGNVWTTISVKFTVDNDNTTIRFRLYLQNPVSGSNLDVDWFKVEKGEESSPYTKAPEDYTTVSKDDYYNYVKLMNDYKDTMLASKADKVVIKNLSTHPVVFPFVRDFEGATSDVWYAYVEARFTKYISGRVRLTLRNYGSSSNADVVEFTPQVSENFESYSLQNGGKIGGIRIIISSDLSPDLEVDMRNLIVLNLTETFGAGNEPTQEEMDELIKVAGYIDGEYALNNKEMLGHLVKGIREKANKKQEDWITLPLYNGVQHGVSPLKVMKDEMGVVHFKGSLTNLVTGSKVFSLPIGYRPDIGATEGYIRIALPLNTGREISPIQINYVGDGYIINPSSTTVSFFDGASYLAKRG